MNVKSFTDSEIAVLLKSMDSIHFTDKAAAVVKAKLVKAFEAEFERRELRMVA